MFKLASFFGAMALAIALTSSPVHAERVIYVNFTDAELTVVDDGETKFSTLVVLPGGEYYEVPVSGVVRRAVMGPTWIPTANMHRDHPGKYKERYGPYEEGNAMGHCKLYIDFDPTVVAEYPILRSVRVHGNARSEHLGKRLSRSCIRIPDQLCPTLVDLSSKYPGKVSVQFHW